MYERGNLKQGKRKTSGPKCQLFKSVEISKAKSPSGGEGATSSLSNPATECVFWIYFFEIDA